MPLVCHPARPDALLHSVEVTLTPGAGGLALRYRLTGALEGLAIPAPGAQLPAERLWAHTCCELFVASEGEAAYREFNFSPGGQWMRFDFGAYRQRLAPQPGPAPRLALQCTDEVLELSVHLPAACLPAGALRVGLSVVAEQQDGSHRYWALTHPPGAPDFHHRDGFALALKALS